MKNSYQDSYLKRIISFFLISHGLPFLLTAVFLVLEKSLYISTPLYGKLTYIGLVSPTFAALFIVFKYYQREERKSYWESFIDFRRISLKWYLIIFSFPLLIRLLGSVIAGLTMGQFQFELSTEMTLSYAFILFFFGPVPEEIGWRGVALPNLVKRFGFNAAVLFLGFMWAIWHFPLFLVEGTYQNQLGLFSPLFWNFMLGAFFTSIIYGVVYYETNRSILGAILFHYIGNLTGESVVISYHAELITTVLRGAIALFILIYYGRNLKRNIHIEKGFK